MLQPETFDVALFPIPGMVSFPGTSAPLHVFEPRYRSMIHHCLDTGMHLAVSHTRKTLESTPTKRAKQAIQDTSDLNRNLQSHEPQDVFSAGPCELLETTEDGRLLVQVHFQHRLKKLEVLQQVPFQTVRCVELVDQPPTADAQELSDLLAELQLVVAAISQSASPALYEIIQQDAWQNLSPEAFSFQIFTYFKFEPDFMQAVLQLDHVDDRLEMIWQGLQRARPE